MVAAKYPIALHWCLVALFALHSESHFVLAIVDDSPKNVQADLSKTTFKCPERPGDVKFRLKNKNSERSTTIRRTLVNPSRGGEFENLKQANCYL